jgi:hypothetical protein
MSIMPHKWVDFGNRINESLALLRVPELILPVDADLRQSIGTTESLQSMQKPGFWTIRRPEGHPDYAGLVRQGIEVVPKTGSDGIVWGVGFRRMSAGRPGQVEPAREGHHA